MTIGTNDLSNPQMHFIRFPTHPRVIAGVTTNKFGDFKGLHEKKNKSPFVIDICGAMSLFSLIPVHGTELVESSAYSEFSAKEADAAHSGNPDIGRLSLIHCSWITLSQGIIEKTLEKMLVIAKKPYSGFKAFIYPGICKNCYEVDWNVRKYFLREYDHLFFTQTDDDHWLMDLSGLIRYRLLALGLEETNVRSMACCSACSFLEYNDEINYPLYSFRKRKDDKRNLVYAKLADDDTVLAATTGDCPYVILY